MIKENVTIKLPYQQDTSFNQRERHLNVEMQKCIDQYNQRGYNVIDRNVINKSATHATVAFTLSKMPSI